MVVPCLSVIGIFVTIAISAVCESCRWILYVGIASVALLVLLYVARLQVLGSRDPDRDSSKSRVERARAAESGVGNGGLLEARKQGSGSTRTRNKKRAARFFLPVRAAAS
jgi:hypothetical protein